MAATVTQSVLPSPASSALHRPVAIAPLPGTQPSPTTFTKKEWIIPPRPKPGRKPVGDAPPTKRKAQNREAQRAFRERRAAKVGELEESLKELETQNRQEVDDLRDAINTLQSDMQYLQQSYADLERAYHREQQARQEVEAEVHILRQGSQASVEAVPLPPRRSTKHKSTVNGGGLHPRQNKKSGDNLTCGRCSGGSRCHCIEEAFEMTGIADDTGESHRHTKRAPSPQAAETRKKSRQQLGPGQEQMEIDFTLKYAASSVLSRDPNMTSEEIQPCGFCSDGSDCICAALVSEASRQAAVTAKAAEKGLNISLPSSARKPSGASECGNNPGSCRQCQGNPTSTLFCKSLAAARSTPARAKACNSPADRASINGERVDTFNAHGTNGHGPTLSCAEAFSTLSRHHAFSQASSDIGSWVSQLTAVPGNVDTVGKTAFEIEAASVMSVIKFFDTRFGQQMYAQDASSPEHGRSE